MLLKRFLALSVSSLVLVACAAPKPRFETASKCFVADSTARIPAARHAEMLRAVAPDGDSLPPCAAAAAPGLRIRPLASSVPGAASSWWLLGANVAAVGVGAGAGLALDNGLYFLAPALTLPLSPIARASYLLEYTDSAGATHREVVKARAGAWFNGREDSRREVLEAASARLANRIYGAALPERGARSVRLSIEPAPLLATLRNDAAVVSFHAEPFLPAGFTMEFSPTATIPVSGLDGAGFSLYFGPRYYFLDRYLGARSGPFVGLEPYGAVGYENDPYAAVGLPALTGYVWQGWRFSVAVEFGAGPIRRWGGPASDVGWMAVGGLNVGAAF